jgi:hypothetical protein
MKKTDKVTIEVTIEELIDIWHYFNANLPAQEALCSHYSCKEWKPKDLISKFDTINIQFRKLFPEATALIYPTVKNLCEPEFKPVEVKLNNDYTATINETSVKVGCQEFSFEKVEELNNEIKKIKK